MHIRTTEPLGGKSDDSFIVRNILAAFGKSRFTIGVIGLSPDSTHVTKFYLLLLMGLVGIFLVANFTSKNFGAPEIERNQAIRTSHDLNLAL